MTVSAAFRTLCSGLSFSGEAFIEFLAAIAGFAIILFILWDGFETMVLPRRVTRKVRLARLFYRYTWIFWLRVVDRFVTIRRAETYLSVYGPLSFLLLMVIWAGTQIFGFSLVHWACGSVTDHRDGIQGFAASLYFSGTTFFTLGLGDVSPHTVSGKILTVVEAGLGFGFLALFISYLPVLNQSFANREIAISLLDARAGSPPSAGEMLRRHSHDQGLDDLKGLLYNLERWSAELLEIHLSYPVLAYFRSQHDNQSWLSALAAILDLSALLISYGEKSLANQAGLTFAMARHTVVDLSLVFNLPPTEAREGRLTAEELDILKGLLTHDTYTGRLDGEIDAKLAELRVMYEPYIHSLSDYFCLDLPRWVPPKGPRDNWQISAWRSIGPSGPEGHHHF